MTLANGICQLELARLLLRRIAPDDLPFFALASMHCRKSLRLFIPRAGQVRDCVTAIGSHVCIIGTEPTAARLAKVPASKWKGQPQRLLQSTASSIGFIKVLIAGDNHLSRYAFRCPINSWQRWLSAMVVVKIHGGFGRSAEL